MNTPTDPSAATQAALAHAENTLAGIPPSPFTTAAFDALKEAIGEFINDMVDESIKLAKRHKSEVVSVNYVQHASEYLIASRSRRVFRHIGTLGGIFLGGALSNILAMAQSGSSFPVLGTLVTIAVGLIGTFLVAIHIARD